MVSHRCATSQAALEVALALLCQNADDVHIVVDGKSYTPQECERLPTEWSFCEADHPQRRQCAPVSTRSPVDGLSCFCTCCKPMAIGAQPPASAKGLCLCSRGFFAPAVFHGCRRQLSCGTIYDWLFAWITSLAGAILLTGAEGVGLGIRQQRELRPGTRAGLRRRRSGTAQRRTIISGRTPAVSNSNFALSGTSGHSLGPGNH